MEASRVFLRFLSSGGGFPLAVFPQMVTNLIDFLVVANVYRVPQPR